MKEPKNRTLLATLCDEFYNKTIIRGGNYEGIVQGVGGESKWEFLMEGFFRRMTACFLVIQKLIYKEIIV